MFIESFDNIRSDGLFRLNSSELATRLPTATAHCLFCDGIAFSSFARKRPEKWPCTETKPFRQLLPRTACFEDGIDFLTAFGNRPKEVGLLRNRTLPKAPPSGGVFHFFALLSKLQRS